VVDLGPSYLSHSGHHDTLYSPTVLILGRIHWILLQSATLLGEKGFTDTHEPTDLGKEVGKDEINWWLTRKETNPEVLRAKTESVLEAVRTLKRAADGLRNRQLPTSYEGLLQILREFSDSHNPEIESLFQYVTWLRSRHELAPTILFTYRVWGTTERGDRWPQIEVETAETIEWTKLLSDIVLGLRNCRLFTYDSVHYGMGADIYDSMSPEEQDSKPVEVPYEEAIRRTAWETFRRCATYFTEIRDSLQNILLDIEKLAEQQFLIHSASFWRDFIVAAITAKKVEPQLWDFKETLTIWHATGDARTKAKVEFAEDVAAFANARGGVILVGIADKTRSVVGLQRGKELENRLQFAASVLKTHLDYDRDLAAFEQVEVPHKDLSRLCLIIVIAQASEVVGVNDGGGHFTYPVRLQTGKHLATRQSITKYYIKSDNFDFVKELLLFVRDHSRLANES
jgi:hypothetical protein